MFEASGSGGFRRPLGFGLELRDRCTVQLLVFAMGSAHRGLNPGAGERSRLITRSHRAIRRARSAMRIRSRAPRSGAGISARSHRAEPMLEARKQTGLKVLLFLVVLTGLFYASKRKIWAAAH